MDDAGPIERLRENATGVVSILVTGIFLGALFTGQDWWLPFMLVGYIVVVPIVALLFGDEEDIEEWWDDETVTEREHTQNQQTDKQALETLRDRYARGELTDEQFERKVERLLETETIEDLEDQKDSEREPILDPE